MSSRESIITNYTDFFAAGCKEPGELKYGIEAEHIITYNNTGKAVPYLGDDGVCSLLHELKKYFTETDMTDGHLIGLLNDEANISLEPGSQLEISITASESIPEISRIYQKYHKIISDILTERKQEINTVGYQPASLVRDIVILPKCRYYFMDQHFGRSGGSGINMMRGTASCQVILDYTDEKDFINKYRCASVLTPLLALISTNTPIFEGAPNHNLLIRTKIWRDVDPARCGIPPETFNPDFSFAKYAEYIINQAAIFEIKDEKSTGSDKKVSEILADKPDWDDDYLLYLSLAFPDVRLRQYIEIRVADSMDAVKMFAYMALIKGLFLDMPCLNKWLSKFPFSIDSIINAQDAIMKEGMNALVNEEPVADLLNQMIKLSLANLDKEESEILLSGFGQYLYNII
ncbi:MAG: glutamate-cysteine ligase family protein [Lachnospiraceae bacterium]|nr:glutamate-cysteine ligase family protein [Lachnospiraceae bacterium]